MRPIAFCFTLLSTMIIGILASLPAQAAPRARTFVSVNGNDANPCTAGSPCKTFQAAHDAVLAGGEISVLDTGGYGTLIVNKAISIVAIGVEASIAIGSGNDGITINAASTEKVSLRGLTLDGTGVGQHGIVFNSGQALTVEDCVVRNMTQFGIYFFSNATTLQTLAVSNSYFNDNGASGVYIQAAGSGAITAAVDRTELNGNVNDGLFVDGHNGTGALSVGVTDSVAANNNANGYSVTSDTSKSVTNLSLTHSLAEGNAAFGVEANGTNATLWLAQSTVTTNTHGYNAVGGGVINSYGDNYLGAVLGSNGGTLSSVTKQ